MVLIVKENDINNWKVLLCILGFCLLNKEVSLVFECSFPFFRHHCIFLSLFLFFFDLLLKLLTGCLLLNLKWQKVWTLNLILSTIIQQVISCYLHYEAQLMTYWFACLACRHEFEICQGSLLFHWAFTASLIVVECWLRVPEVPGSIRSQGPRHTKDVLKMVPGSSLV